MTESTYRTDLFAHRQALVVGGTGGIGEAVTRALAACGARVTATGATDDEVARATVHGERVRVVALDVRDAAAIDAVVAMHACLDIVVNCAGVIRRGAEHDPRVFADVLAINLTGTMQVCTAARPLLAARGGAIVNTASMLSFFGGGLVPAYSASKGGVAQLSKSLAIAYAGDGIRVNAIAPGWIATVLTEPLQRDEVRNAAILSRTPLGRWGTPQDVADAVIFLCSPAARFVTGAVLAIDGGYLVA